MLFTAIVVIGAFGTSWNTVSELPQNQADQSNIEGIGMLIFTHYVAPFEVLSIVLLASLIGAIYLAKGEGNR
nr:F420H2 dehydrogenase subunit FpoJ [Methanosarcina sp. DH1]